MIVRPFTDEEKERIWEMHQAGVPVKRIARRLGRNNASLRELIGRTGGVRPRAQVVNERHLSWLSEKRSRGAWRQGCPRGPSPKASVEHRRRFVGRSTDAGSKNPNGEQPDYPASIDFLSTLPTAKKVPSVVLTSDKPIDFLGNGDAPTYHPNWVRAQYLLARSLGGTQVTNTQSGHFIQTENPALVIAESKVILAAARGRNRSHN